MSRIKNILFVMGRFGVGGTERVTIALCNEWVRRGASVTLVAFDIYDKTLLIGMDRCVEIVELAMPAFRLSRVRRLRQVIQRIRPDWIINQWALPAPVSIMLKYAMFGLRTRLMVVQHSMPDQNKKILTSSGLKRKVWHFVSALNLRVVYALSDVYVVLSKSYIGRLANFIGISTENKIRAVGNPLTMSVPTGIVKENLIIYIGRFSPEKRVDRVIEVWREIEKALPSWSLEILGDGPERQEIEMSARGLPRVKFCGFQPPAQYYARAKILLLTSEFEGLPMSILEGASAGCVPVVYGSFSSAYDILSLKEGVVVDVPWAKEKFSEAVKLLARDDRCWLDMSLAAREMSSRYTIESVVDDYERIMV